MIKIIIHGLGKMGAKICELAHKGDTFEITAGIDKFTKKNQEIFPIFKTLEDCDMNGDVIIDFSIASAVDELIEVAVQRRLPLVICTTALSGETIKNIQKASKNIPIFKSSNMSLGINLIASLIRKISTVLYEENFDIEIIEKHHNQKIDAPSGTALFLADIIKQSLEDIEYTYDRSKTSKKRERNELGLHAIRGGTIAGEHEIIFAGKDEVIEIKHTAYSKELFAVGALKAAEFLVSKKAGLYDMQNLLYELLNKTN